MKTPFDRRLAVVMWTAALVVGTLSACGRPSEVPIAPPVPGPRDEPEASVLVSIEAGTGTDSGILERMRVANIAADSAIRNERPFLALLELEKLEQSGLPDTYRAMVWVNIGLVRGKIGAVAAARAAYDRAIELERPLGRHYAMTLKAVFLAEQGQAEESIAAFEELLARGDILPEERSAYTENIRVLRAAPRQGR